MVPKALAGWHEVVKTRDHMLLDDLLAADVVFHSPVVHAPQRGKAITAKYLGAAVAVLGGGFCYVEEWVGPSSAALEFVTTVDGIEVNGVDLIGWNADSQIDRFKVMVRPLKAIEAVRACMPAALAG
jgi:hypothetical protein